MPKLKTHQSTKKRVRKTKTGKLLREHSYQNHFLHKKSSARKRAYNQKHPVDSSKRKTVQRALRGNK